jgi:hypothetical protein
LALATIVRGWAMAEQGRTHHQLERRIDERARLFRVKVLHQFHGAFDVREQGGHRLALTVDGRCSVALFGCDANLFRGRWYDCRRIRAWPCDSSKRGAAINAEFGVNWGLSAAFRTMNRKRAAALRAEAFSPHALGSAF